MNISDSNYNYNANITGGNAVSGSKTETANNNQQPMSGNAQIGQIAEGQVFNGQIVDVTNNHVSIMLEGNKTLVAQMTEALNLNIGDSLMFMVKENNGANVVIKPYGTKTEAMKDSAIFKVLDNNNFMPTAKNYQIAEALMNSNMPLDKASMQRVMQQSYKFPEASIDTLVALNKMGITVNESNINQYEAYLSNNHQLMNDLINMGSNLSEFFGSEIAGMTDGTQILNLNSTLLGIFTDTSDIAVLNTSSNPQEVVNTDIVKDSASIIANKDINVQIDNSAAFLANKLSLNETSLKHILNKLTDMGFDNTILENIVNKSETPLQLLNNLNQLLGDPSMLTDVNKHLAIKELLMSEGYKDILSSAVRRKMTLDGNNMQEPVELDELYNKIYDKTNKLMEAFSGGGSQNGESMSGTAKNLQQRLDFIQNLNNMYAYAQIPVRVSGNDMNSELFVYMNKKNLKDAKENVSALLHLDMEHLGPTDVHVSLHGTSVHTKFYVEDESSAKIIDEHMTMLEKAINENGYSLTNEVIAREPALNSTGNMVVDKMLGKDLEQSVKRYSFDVRM